MLGYGLAGAISPYLGVVLRNHDPRLPFVISGVVLLATTLALSRVERGLALGELLHLELIRVAVPSDHPQDGLRGRAIAEEHPDEEVVTQRAGLRDGHPDPVVQLLAARLRDAEDLAVGGPDGGLAHALHQPLPDEPIERAVDLSEVELPKHARFPRPARLHICKNKKAQ